MTQKETKELQVAEKQAIEKHMGEPTHAGVMWIPEVDIVEDRDAVTLRADLPGVKKENVDIDVRDGELLLTATLEPLPRTWQPVCGEYQVGGYSRRFVLGEQIDRAKISANLENGVLTLVLPKAEAHRPRRIAIN